jgi:DNA ligase-3
MVKCTAATIPSWLDVDKGLVPAFYVPDPKKCAKLPTPETVATHPNFFLFWLYAFRSPVWEIEGAQFTKSERHTAAGISIRFPRIARFRDDKDWSTATTLKELVNLAQESMKNVKDVGDEDDDDDEKPKAKKAGKKAAAAAPKAGPSLPVASPKKPKASGATTAAPAAAANRNIMDAFGISRPGSGGAGPKQPIDAPNGITYVVGDVTVPIGDTSVARVRLNEQCC